MNKKQLSMIRLIFIFTIISFIIGTFNSSAMEYTKIPILIEAQNTLDKDLLKGKNYQVENSVKNDGIINTYQLTTDYGSLQIESTAELLNRINELRALVIMEEMDRAEIFGDALVDAITAPVKGVVELVTSPIDTTTNIIKGTGRFLSNVGNSIFSSDPDQDNVFKVALGYDVAKRQFAFELGIDPYTDYDPVVNRLGEIAKAAVAGGLTPKAAMAMVDHDIATAMQISGTAYGMMQLVRDKSPGELKKINKIKLEKMGIDAELIKKFLESYRYNPQERTLLIGELETMNGVSGRDVFISNAILAEEKTIVTSYRVRAQLIAGYHNKVGKIEKIQNIAGVLTLKRTDGVVIVVAPADYISWTQKIALKTDAYEKRLATEEGVTGKEFWITGKFDKTASEQYMIRGWKLKENIMNIVNN